MKATTTIDRTEITDNLAAALNGQGDTSALQDTEAQAGQETVAANNGRPESELRAAARRRGLNLKELAHLMGVSYRYLCQVSNGHRPWSPMMRERALAVLGEVPGQGVVYRPGRCGAWRGEHLHPGAGQATGYDPAAGGGPGGADLRVRHPGGEGRAQSESRRPGPDGVGPGRPGEGRGRPAR